VASSGFTSSYVAGEYVASFFFGPADYRFWSLGIKTKRFIWRRLTEGVFTSHANPKYFLFYPSHRIFGRMHGALNVGKKDN
jgi:hypothetical protein